MSYPQPAVEPLRGSPRGRSLVNMGYQTDFVGYLQIDPPLGPRERSFINRVSGSLFLQDPNGGLHVADQEDEALGELVRQAPRGGPTGPCVPRAVASATTEATRRTTWCRGSSS